jgi:acetyl-CoA C-acetyltransferase
MAQARVPGAAAIVGQHELATRKAPGRTAWDLAVEAGRLALADAGLGIADVDALYIPSPTSMPAVMGAEYLGIHPVHMDSSNIGGSSYVSHAGHAAAAIAAGRFECALILYGSTFRSDSVAVGTSGQMRAINPYDIYESPYGLTLVGAYSLTATRHMAKYGTTSEQLAAIAVAARAYAANNPDARYRDPITVDDVLASRMIADPLHMLDCCVITDGAGAIVVASAARAMSCRKPPVWIAGAAETVMHNDGGHGDFIGTGAMRTAPRAFAMAGLSPADVDVLCVYDSYTITVLVTVEDLGFCAKGEGGPFLAEPGRIGPGGSLPLNPDGGGLSSNHPGMRGVYLLCEATRQLRGESVNQVPDAAVAVVHGTGGFLGLREGAASLLLTTERPS